MKKILLLLCLLFAFTATARATDVNIGATTIPGFNAASLPADMTVSPVSVTFNSPTVTSSAKFGPWIGMGGFRIAINSVAYTVAYVSSASSLTLTTNYAGGDSSSATVIWYKYVELRIYADSSFQPAGKTYVIQPGAPGSGAWYRRIAASILNESPGINNLYIPQITLDSTTDSLTNQSARYYAAFYRPGGSFIQIYDCFDSFSLQPTGSTTWPDICLFNSRQVIVQDSSTYTATQIDSFRTGCTIGQSLYYAVTGLKPACLNFGAGLSLVGNTLTSTVGNSYTTVLNNGTPLTQRSILNFLAPGHVTTDNAGASRTDVDLDPDLNALASTSTNGLYNRTGSGTSNTITTSAGLAGVITDETGSGALTFGTSPTITTPAITGGAHTAITSLGIRSTGGGAFDLTPNNTETLTAGRTLTFTVNDANRTINLGGNLTLANPFTTSGAFALTLTQTGPTNVTLPTSGTLAANGNNLSFFSSTTSAQLATLLSDETGSGAAVFGTGPTLTSPRIGTALLDTNGNELITVAPTASAVNEISITNAATGNGPTIAVSGGDANPNLNIAAKGTGRVVIKGYPYTLNLDTSAVGNIGTGLDNLHSYSLPAGSLAANGDYLEVTYDGTFSAANDKTITVTFGGQTFSNATFDIDAGNWEYKITYTRLTSTTVRATGLISWGSINRTQAGVSGGAGLFAIGNANLTVSDLGSNATTLLVQGQAAGAPGDNEVVQNLSIIKLVQR